MGGRHLRALDALYESGMANVELVAVCDTRKENALHLADKAEEMLGSRPEVFTSMEDMRKKRPDIRPKTANCKHPFSDIVNVT